jgi:hypothetical protein
MTHTMLRIFVASVALLAITIVLLLHATHHGAHANSPAHCGFWTEIEAACRVANLSGSPIPAPLAREDRLGTIDLVVQQLL